MSGLINKVKEAVTGTGAKDTNESAAANQGYNDYDSSRSREGGGLTGSDNYTSSTSDTASGHGSGLTGSGNYGSDNYGSDGRRSGNTEYDSSGNTSRGPHSSNLENKLDPRVDSDGSRGTSGGYGSSGTGNTGYGSSGTDTTGYGTTSSGLGSTGSSATAGPHSSNLANKADPRVDSDQDGRRGYDSSNTSGGYGSGTTGQGLTGRETGSSGYGSTVGEHGHHGRHGQVEDIVHGGEHYTETANKLDPHVSGGDNTSSGYGARSEGTGGYGSGSGTGDGTSGPHKSSLLNKVDPRVDSDRDGSNTYGGNQTTVPGKSVNVATMKPSDAIEALGGVQNADPKFNTAGRNGPHLVDDLRKYGNGIE